MANSASSPQPTPVDSRWILLVDDEPTILPLITSMLERHGLPVREAGDGATAMAAIESAASPPALLICDVMMPGIDGLELTRQILGRFPRLKVLFISGHLTDVSWWPMDLRAHRFLAKPFSIAELGNAVTEVLEAQGPVG